MNCIVISIDNGDVWGAIPFRPNSTQQAFRRARSYSKYWEGQIELLCRNTDGNWQLMDSWNNDLTAVTNPLDSRD